MCVCVCVCMCVYVCVYVCVYACACVLYIYSSIGKIHLYISFLERYSFVLYNLEINCSLFQCK